MKRKYKIIAFSLVIIFIAIVVIVTPKLVGVAKDKTKQIIDYVADSFDTDGDTNENQEEMKTENESNEIKDGFSNKIIDLQIREEKLSINTNYNNEVYEVESLYTDVPIEITLNESTTSLGDEMDIFVEGENISEENSIVLNSLNKDENIEIKLKYNDFQRTYSIQTLPSSFPEIEKYGNSKYEGDYYSNLYIEGNPYIYKMSDEGNILYYKNVRGEDRNSVTNFAKWNLAEKERYSYFSKSNNENIDFPGYNYGDFVIMDENYEEVDRVHTLPSNDYDIHTDKAETHDFIMIDDEHYMLMNYVVDTPNSEDLNDDIKIDTKVLAAYVQEIKDGKVVWEWISTEHNEFYNSSVDSNDYNNSERYAADYMHINSLFIDPKDDNVIMSFRNQDAIVKIDKSSKEILWRFGGKNDNFELSQDQKPSKQHHATMTDAGNLLIFDNGTSNKQTRIIEANLDEEEQKVKEYKEFKIEDVHSTFTGSVQKIDEENDVFLIGWGLNRENQYALMSEIYFKNDQILTEVIEKDIENHSYRFLKFK